MQLRKAERRKAKLRIGVSGPSGSGKTYTSLLIAKGLTDDWSKIAVIDTENGSAELYSHLGEYNVLTLTAPFSPERYIEAIDACIKAGVEVLIIDSTSHEWDGKGGCLEINELIAQTKFRGNTWSAWSATTPRHQKFIESITQSPIHVITTARSKTDTIQTEDKKIKKVGLKDIQREGFEYELTLSFNIDRDKHYATASKDRTGMFIDLDPFVITEDTGKKLKEWAESGSEPLPVPPPTPAQHPGLDSSDVTDERTLKSRIMHNLKRLGLYDLPKDYTSEQIGKYIADAVKVLTDLDLVSENLKEILATLEKMRLDSEDDRFTISLVTVPDKPKDPTPPVNGVPSESDTHTQGPDGQYVAKDPMPAPVAENVVTPKPTPAPADPLASIYQGDPWGAVTEKDISALWDLATSVEWVSRTEPEALVAWIKGEGYTGVTDPMKMTKSQVRNLVKALKIKEAKANDKTTTETK